MKILIMGLPGAGKTTLAKILSRSLQAVHLNGDRVRETLSSDLGFSLEDRLEQARRMGCMAQLIKESGHYVVADFVCPTNETRRLFNADWTIWMNTINEGRFEDTNALFEPPLADLVITDWKYSLHDIRKELHLW